MGMSPTDQLRMLLGEMIPEGGSEGDTAFTNCQLQEMIDGASGSVERAAATGWRAKAAQYADLVDVTEGNASRSMSDLHEHALQMVKLYDKSTEGPTEGRTTIGRIVRRS